MLQAVALLATVDRVVHPRAALLAFARMQVEVELADQRAVAVADVEEAHVRMPGHRRRLADGDAEDRLDQLEQAGEHALLGEVLLHFLLGERIALLAQLLRREREVPRLRVGDAELVARERDELCVVALRRTGGRACRGRG